MNEEYIKNISDLAMKTGRFQMLNKVLSELVKFERAADSESDKQLMKDLYNYLSRECLKGE